MYLLPRGGAKRLNGAKSAFEYEATDGAASHPLRISIRQTYFQHLCEHTLLYTAYQMQYLGSREQTCSVALRIDF